MKTDDNKIVNNYYIGQGVTEVLWSDRHAYYINKILKTNANEEPTELEIIRAKVTCIDYFAENWEVSSFEESSKGYTKTIKRTRKDKKGNRYWTSNGTKEGTFYHIGSVEEYEDPCF